jgi:AcrR family transcriptional regulator
MAAVAERAGVSRRAVYLHFTSRAELLTELFAHVSEQEGLAASLQPVWAAPDAAADMLWALMSFDLLEELLVDRGWSVRRYRTHLAALFRSTFLCNVGRADEGALPPDP